jgi:hypothetical protein
VPPPTPAVIGRRSEAPRVLSERLGAEGRYAVALEGIAGRAYSFRVRAPDPAIARALKVDVTAGAARLADAPGGGVERLVSITFPSAGANADGYTTVTLAVR